jgi:peptidoglycan hydrolase-like protein with peptidoglycan-binding domain
VNERAYITDPISVVLEIWPAHEDELLAVTAFDGVSDLASAPLIRLSDPLGQAASEHEFVGSDGLIDPDLVVVTRRATEQERAASGPTATDPSSPSSTSTTTTLVDDGGNAVSGSGDPDGSDVDDDAAHTRTPTTVETSTTVEPPSAEEPSSDGRICPLYEHSEYEPFELCTDGPAVETLQQALVFFGYLDGGADGYFGPGTERAVRDVQLDYGVPDDGIAAGQWYRDFLETYRLSR